MRPLRAVVYARLSPTPRGDQFKGGNLEQQIATCRARCEEHGWQVVRVVEDRDTSAASRKARPGWRKLLGMVEARQVDVIIGRHYDRLYRRPVDLEELIRLTEDTGVRIVAAEGDALGIDLTSATGLLQARILVAFAAGETDIKAERQRAGHRRRIEAGLPWWGNRPFGYEKDLRIREEEAEHIRNAYRAVLEGVPIISLVREWNERGVLTVRDGLWTSTTLRRLLTHPRNAGIVVYDGIEQDVQAAWPPLVDIELFRAVTGLLSRPTRTTNAEPFVHRFGILSGIATCAVRQPDDALCGGALALGPGRPRMDGTQLRKYRCTTCHRSSFPAGMLEDYVMAVLFRRTNVDSGPARHRLPATRPAAPEPLLSALNDLRNRKDELRELFVSAAISPDDYVTGNRLVDQRLVEARTRLAVARLKPSTDLTPQDRRPGFVDLVDMYCEPARHVELRSFLSEEVEFLAITPGSSVHQRRLLSDVISRWRGDELPIDPDHLIPVGDPTWIRGEARMAAARATWDEVQMRRRTDLMRERSVMLAWLKQEPLRDHAP